MLEKLKDIKQFPLVEKLVRSYEALEVRDKKALALLAVTFSVLVIYFGIWSPAGEFYANARTIRDRQLDLIQWMLATEKSARLSDKTQSGVPSGQSLLTQVSRTAKSHNITPNRLQPEGADGVSVWFDKVNFNDLIGWVQELQKAGSVHVKQITIDRQPESGMVSARLELQS